MSDSPWKHCTLDDLVETNPEALSGSTPPSSRFQYIDINSVTLGKVDWQNVTEVEFKTAPSRARRIVRPGDTIFCTVRPSLQAHAHADWSDRDGYICSTGFAVLRPKQTDKRFIFHTVFSEAVASHVRRREVGSSYPAVNESELKQTPLRVPEDEIEQSHIAEILDTLDAAIREAEAVVAKLRQVKAGLLHDLLTRGLDEHGQLRDPARHPEQFQDSALGKIPRSWSVKALDAIAILQRGKFTPRPRNDPKYFVGGSLPFAQTGDIAAANGEYLHEASQSLNAAGAAVSKLFPAGTVAITIAANIGDTAIFGIPMYLTDSVVGAVAREPNNARFLAMVLKLKKRELQAIAPQSAQANINLAILRPIQIATPRSEEQSEIASCYFSFLARIASEELSLSKLHSLKRGLAHDLLTGAVRVKLDAGRNRLA